MSGRRLPPAEKRVEQRVAAAFWKNFRSADPSHGPSHQKTISGVEINDDPTDTAADCRADILPGYREGFAGICGAIGRSTVSRERSGSIRGTASFHLSSGRAALTVILRALRALTLARCRGHPGVHLLFGSGIGLSERGFP
jgi:hypothetical protein